MRAICYTPGTTWRRAIRKASGPSSKTSKQPPAVKIPKRPTQPDRIARVVENPTLSDHLAIVTRAVFQAGLSWAFIDTRWDRYVAEFDGFDAEQVAAYDDAAIARLLEASDIIHSRAKIEGTIRNARMLIDVEREFGTIRAYHTSFPSYVALRRDTAKRFAYMGDMNTYYWLFRTGAPVPDVETWMKLQNVDHPRIREMVTAARAAPVTLL